MKELKLDYLIAYFDGIHSFLEPNFVFVLSGYKSIGESMVLLHSEGISTLITTPSWDVKRAKQNSTSTNIIGTDNLINILKQLLDSKKIDLVKVGFIGLNSLKQSGYSKLSFHFRNQLNHVDNHFLELTSCKNDQEIKRAMKATWIAERGYEKLLEVA